MTVNIQELQAEIVRLTDEREAVVARMAALETERRQIIGCDLGSLQGKARLAQIEGELGVLRQKPDKLNEQVQAAYSQMFAEQDRERKAQQAETLPAFEAAKQAAIEGMIAAAETALTMRGMELEARKLGASGIPFLNQSWAVAYRAVINHWLAVPGMLKGELRTRAERAQNGLAAWGRW